MSDDQAHYKKVIDDVQALFEAKREEAAIWQAAYETEKGFREQEQQEPNYKKLYEQACERLDVLDKELAKYEQPVQRNPLSGYINRAGINANDSPHIVVEKLERAIEAAHGIKENT